MNSYLKNLNVITLHERHLNLNVVRLIIILILYLVLQLRERMLNLALQLNLKKHGFKVAIMVFIAIKKIILNYINIYMIALLLLEIILVLKRTSGGLDGETSIKIIEIGILKFW